MKMKTISKIFSVLTLSVLIFTGCMKDNYDEPTSTIKGRVVYQGTPLQLRGNEAVKLYLYQRGYAKHVSIGGKQAVVISVKGESLYCLVPEKAYSGEIQVKIDYQDQALVADASTKFDYQKKMVVSTLCGYRNERDDQGWHDGKFSECTGFREDAIMV